MPNHGFQAHQNQNQNSYQPPNQYMLNMPRGQSAQGGLQSMGAKKNEDDQNLEQPYTNEDDLDEENEQPFHINANVFQIAMLNKMLPKGYKFDILDVIRRQTEIHMKKTAGMVNYMNKKPEIQNELKQKKLI